MLPDARRQRILRLLDGRDVARPVQLAEQLRVSPETIRRDLVILHREGAVHRVHGGVVRARLTPASEPSRGARLALHGTAKEQIAALVAGLVEDDDTVIFDVGTTVETCALRLRSTFRGRVITNSIPVVNRLAGRPDLELHMLGGHIRQDELSCSGADTVRFVEQFHVSKAILGSGGVHAVAGLTDYTIEEIAVRRAMIAAAERVYVVADATKLGHVALRHVCDWSVVTAIVTDFGADRQQLVAFREAGVHVLLPAQAPAEQANNGAAW